MAQVRARKHSKASNDTSSKDVAIGSLPQSEDLDRNGNFVRKWVLSIAYPMEFVNEIPTITTRGTWYLSPEYHVLESSIMICLAMAIIIFSDWMMSDSIPESLTLITNSEQSAWANILKYVLGADLILHAYYKSNNSPKGRGLWWMLQPCGMNHASLVFFLHFPRYLTPETLQYLVMYTGGTLTAIAAPDMSSCVQFGSSVHFWFQHVVVFLLPYWFWIKNAQITTQTVSIWIAMKGNSYFALYSFGVLEISSIISGVNLNYMLSPPMVPFLLRSKKNYRIVQTLFMTCVVHTVFGYLLPKSLLLAYHYLTAN